jgi:hypothetical protein
LPNPPELRRNLKEVYHGGEINPSEDRNPAQNCSYNLTHQFIPAVRFDNPLLHLLPVFQLTFGHRNDAFRCTFEGFVIASQNPKRRGGPEKNFDTRVIT